MDSVEAYLKSIIQVEDDCASLDFLDVAIEHVDGTCSDTEVKVTPVHEQEKTSKLCQNGYLLNGTSLNLVLELDEVTPQVSCGFSGLRSDDRILNAGTTLFVEPTASLNLINSGFYFDIQVSRNFKMFALPDRNSSCIVITCRDSRRTVPERSTLTFLSRVTNSLTEAWLVLPALDKVEGWLKRCFSSPQIGEHADCSLVR